MKELKLNDCLADKFSITLMHRLQISYGALYFHSLLSRSLGMQALTTSEVITTAQLPGTIARRDVVSLSFFSSFSSFFCKTIRVRETLTLPTRESRLSCTVYLAVSCLLT